MTRRSRSVAAVRCMGAALAVGCLTATTALGAQATGAKSMKPRTTYEDLQMLSGVLNQLRVNHPDTLDTHQLLMSAITAMVGAADPHSYVIAYARLDSAKEKAYREKKLYPVGISFRYYGGSPVVIGTVAGSQAAREDILPGDELIAIEGVPVSAQSVAELDLALAGERNSYVTVQLERERADGTVIQLPRKLKREKLDEGTAVPAAFMLPDGVGYLRVTTFDNRKVDDDVHDELSRLEKSGMRMLLLDLRDNGGGLLEEAATMAGEFLPRGKVVYVAEGRKRQVNDTVKVSRSFWSSQRQYPMVVMVNDGTASAAELVAGALQDHDRAVIWGRPSFGKSLLMQGFPLPDGSIFVMTVGRVKTPCGRVVQREYRGITRHEYYRRSRAERDTLGRPSCRTASGRTVYGGGGIYPDVRAQSPGVLPQWTQRINEGGLALRWVGTHLGAATTAYPTLDALAAAPALAPGALAEFRSFATAQGVTIPAGADADSLLQRLLLPRIADAKWGDAGYYRILAVLDPEVGEARKAFTKAAALQAGGGN